MLLKKTKPKLFCIGLNKTGTTTLETVLKQFQYKLGNQAKAELLIEDWHRGNFKPIIKFCSTAEAFQDIPFSLPHTYKALDENFKNAKFILTERDSAEQWYTSLTRFHSKLWADGERIPTIEDLKKADYRAPGYTYRANRYMYNTPESDPYNKAQMLKFYNAHNQAVKSYFKNRPEKLLTINVSNASDYAKLCLFLNKPVSATDFPWKNKTSDA